MNKKLEGLSQQFIQFSTDKLLELIHNNSPLYRAHALTALIQRLGEDETLLNTIVENLTKPGNMNARLFGTISVSHIGIVSLLQTESQKANDVARHLVNHWPEPDRDDLLWFIKSESIPF